MKIGYARVSMADQNLRLQLDALYRAQVDNIFSDTASGSKDDRQGLMEALAAVKHGDSLIVWKLDRLGRSLPHLIETVNKLKDRGVEFVSLTENLDTSTPTGKLTFYIFAALAEFVRDTIRERTMAGLAAAKARGHQGGRPFKLKGKRLQMVLNLAKDENNKLEDICSMANISPATFYRYMRREKGKSNQ